MTTKSQPADIRLRNLTVRHLQVDRLMFHRVEEILYDEDYELIMPPDVPQAGDQFLGNGTDWHPVSDRTYIKDGNPIVYGPSSYIVRRPREHLRMQNFFFGKRK